MIVIGWYGAGFSLAMIPAALLLFACAVVVQLTVTTTGAASSSGAGAEPVRVALAPSPRRRATRYPLSIYPRSIRTLLTWVVPFAFVNFVPVGILTGALPPGG